MCRLGIQMKIMHHAMKNLPAYCILQLGEDNTGGGFVYKSAHIQT